MSATAMPELMGTHREWFEARGFKGDMDIDQFCVRLEQAHHEATHGGGELEGPPE
ncbi:hypothetical protein [Myxococcus qinghaiensis]|uniref:hypothetical protein n=1 Tax=Myxococcus qinghaiensis TaxID=2906758 RepID=UPI0020A7CBE1|nr:hypothetical protein [Myxococcus qinghaiensis]MCP3165288.1 hypothetical protein [Myxococcus qinghaiensis]